MKKEKKRKEKFRVLSSGFLKLSFPTKLFVLFFFFIETTRFWLEKKKRDRMKFFLEFLILNCSIIILSFFFDWNQLASTKEKIHNDCWNILDSLCGAMNNQVWSLGEARPSEGSEVTIRKLSSFHIQRTYLFITIYNFNHEV